MRYVGIDWAHETHAVAVLDEAGTILGERLVPQSTADLAALMSWLDELAPSEEGRAVGLETGAGLLLEYLLDHQHAVYVFNPKVVDRYRDRHSPAGSKDDRRDARVIADILRIERNRYRPFEPDSELTTEMRLRVRARQRLVEKRTAATNELGDALRHYFPAAVSLPSHWRDPWFLEFLRQYPDPDGASLAQRVALGRLLRKHRVRKWTAAGLLEHLRTERLPVRPALLRAYRALVLDLVEQIAVLNTQIDQADEQIAALLKQHPDRDIILSLTGVGITLAARMLAEIGDDRSRLADPTSLQARAGTAPVTKQSGKGRRQVLMRRACNRHLQNAFFQQASTSRARSTWARAYYDSQRRDGRGHAAANRNLSNKWAKIVAAMLLRRELYDETRHTQHLELNRVPWWKPQAA